jgi:pyrroline-5-carboxylate reductase
MSQASQDPEAPSLRDVTGTLVLVGAGKMGTALLEGWMRLGLEPARVAIIEPQPSQEMAALAARGLRINPTMNAVGEPAAIVVAVKPQNAAEIMPFLSQAVGPNTVVLSIMAGKTLEFLAEALPASTPIVRSMPNMPASIGHGITVAVPNERVTGAQRELAHKLLVATGAVEWVEDEALLDPVTALSGSGPAYVFLLAESLAKAGAAAGLPADLAARLARATVAGSGELLHRSQQAPETLRQSVTSPGGTTAAALDVLMAAEGMTALMSRAVLAATRRSRELAG